MTGAAGHHPVARRSHGVVEESPAHANGRRRGVGLQRDLGEFSGVRGVRVEHRDRVVEPVEAVQARTGVDRGHGLRFLEGEPARTGLGIPGARRGRNQEGSGGRGDVGAGEHHDAVALERRDVELGLAVEFAHDDVHRHGDGVRRPRRARTVAIQVASRHVSRGPVDSKDPTLDEAGGGALGAPQVDLVGHVVSGVAAHDVDVVGLADRHGRVGGAQLVEPESWAGGGRRVDDEQVEVEGAAVCRTQGIETAAPAKVQESGPLGVGAVAVQHPAGFLHAIVGRSRVDDGKGPEARVRDERCGIDEDEFARGREKHLEPLQVEVQLRRERIESEVRG